MTSTTSSKSDTVNYLLLYEAMVRHQDLEFSATTDHIENIVDRIKTLGKPSSQQQQEEEGHVPKGMITYRQMRRCLLRLGYTWHRSAAVMNSINNAADAVDNYYYDDDNISVISGDGDEITILKDKITALKAEVSRLKKGTVCSSYTPHCPARTCLSRISASRLVKEPG